MIVALGILAPAASRTEPASEAVVAESWPVATTGEMKEKQTITTENSRKPIDL